MARLEAAERERDEVAQQLVQSEKGKRKISVECDTYKAAYSVWIAKTEWVQQGVNEGTISAKYLGLHRADVMARLLGEAEKEREMDEAHIADLMADLNRVGHENDALRAKIEQMEKQEPVAKVRVHQAGGNAGLAWSVAPLNDFDSLPLLCDGDKLYLAHGAQEAKP